MVKPQAQFHCEICDKLKEEMDLYEILVLNEAGLVCSECMMRLELVTQKMIRR